MGPETKHSYAGRKVRSYSKSSSPFLEPPVNVLFHRDKDYLESLVAEAEEAVQGKRVSKEDELDEAEKKL